MTLSDFFDFGEDRTSHGYAEFGGIAIGAYTCQSFADSTIRVGNGTMGDSIHFTVAVNVGADSVTLSFTQPWHGGSTPPLLFVDGIAQGSVPYGGLCNFTSVTLTNQQANTADGLLKIKIWDNASGFNMDGQMSFLNVYSNNFLVGINTPFIPKIKMLQGETEISFLNLTQTSQLVIYDATGKTVFRKMLSSYDNTAGIECLKPGIYFCQIENGEQSLSTKILIH